MSALSLGLWFAVSTLSAGDTCKPALAQVDVVQSSGTQAIELTPLFAHAERISSAAKDGSKHDYDAIRLVDVLTQAKLPLGKALRGKPVGWSVLAEAKDDYKASFALAEIDPDIGDRAVWIAACRDGKALPDDEGPLRLLVPDDKRPARAVRQLLRLRIVTP